MPFKVAPPDELDRLGEIALEYLRSRFWMAPVILMGGLPAIHVVSFVDIMFHLDTGVQNVRPCMDRLACKGLIFQWFDIRTGLVRYMYRPTPEEMRECERFLDIAEAPRAAAPKPFMVPHTSWKETVTARNDAVEKYAAIAGGKT